MTHYVFSIAFVIDLNDVHLTLFTGRQTSSEDATFTCLPFQENCAYNDLSLTHLAIAVCAKVVRFCNIRQLFAVSCLCVFCSIRLSLSRFL